MSGYNLKKKYCIFCLKIFFTITNSVDPDEMQHDAAFHLGLHFLSECPFMGFPVYKGLTIHNYHHLSACNHREC